jgi:hypothetical protein
MATLIAFSGSPGDCIYVAEDVTTVSQALAVGAPAYARLTQVPTQTDAFGKTEVLLNVARVAFVRGA